jgi:Holliday junction resolvase RusA-like endonuclease
MSIIRRLEILTPPIAWKRARRKGDVYYDEQVNDKTVYAYIARAALKRYIPVSGPIKLTLRFHLPMPKSWSAKKKKAMEGAYCCCTPDLDNYVKFILDAFNEVIWLDDKQVVSIEASKTYGANPRTELEYQEMQ